MTVYRIVYQVANVMKVYPKVFKSRQRAYNNAVKLHKEKLVNKIHIQKAVNWEEI